MHSGRPVAEIVSRAWCAALGVEDAEPTDNFFTSGGHSFASVQLAMTVATELHIEFPLQTLFADSLADLITECADRAAAVGTVSAPTGAPRGGVSAR
jgi:acyl carrier protein